MYVDVEGGLLRLLGFRPTLMHVLDTVKLPKVPITIKHVMVSNVAVSHQLEFIEFSCKPPQVKKREDILKKNKV